MQTFTTLFIAIISVAFIVLFLNGMMQFLKAGDSTVVETAKNKVIIGALGALFSGTAYYVLAAFIK